MPDIKATVRVLHLEDSALDAQLIRSKLESEGLVCIITLVDTRQAFENALACQSFDLIICDFNLPSYDGHTAVKLVREKNLLTPLILISGSVKADDAVRALQFGATDYILKHNLDRLPSAVSRALEEFDRHEKYRISADKLRVIEERFKAIVLGMAEGVVVQDMDGKILTCNSSAEKILGLTQSQLVGLTPHDPSWNIVHEDGSPFPGETHPSSIATKTGQPVIDAIMGVRKRDGALTWISVNAQPLRHGPDDPPYSILTTFTDITTRKHAEQERSKAEQFTRAVLDALSSHIAVLDENGMILATNRAWQDFALLNGRPWEPRGSDLDYLAVCDRASANGNVEAEIAAKLIRAVIAGESKESSFQYSCHAPNELRWFRCRITRFPGESPTRVVTAHENITQIELAELQANRSRKQFQDLFEFAPEAIVIFNSDNLIKLVNRQVELVFGYERNELIGQSVKRLIANLPEERVRSIASRDMSGAGQLGSEQHVLKGLKKNGTLFPIDVSFSPLESDEGLIVASARDVTEQQLAFESRQKLEEQLHHSQKMDAIGRLAGGVAHDFNNQLHAIMGYADLLKIEANPKKIKYYVDNICTAAQRSADLTKNLLAFSRKGQYQITPLNIHRIILEIIAVLDCTIDKRIEVTRSFAARPDVIMGDPSLVQNALLNIAVNARDAMKEGGKLNFQTEIITLDKSGDPQHAEIAPGRYLQISISDTGVGMSDEIKKHIFEPFFTTKPTGAGTGMGLASVYGTVKTHKGVIDVVSQPGHGTTFKLAFPLADQPAPPPQAEEDILRATARQLRVKDLCVLLIEDEEILRSMFAEMLSSAGMFCFEAEHGRVGVEIYRKNWKRIDLVILDMIMPEMNGPDTFRVLKQINPKVRVLLSTGYSLNNEVQQILNEGVQGFIQKPFMKQDLIEMIIDTIG